MTLDQIDEVIAAYEPVNVSDVTTTKIAISDMLGDLMFVCPSEEFALVLNNLSIYLFGNNELSQHYVLSLFPLLRAHILACSVGFFLQAVNRQGIKVYEYFLTHRWSASPFAEWHGVVHSADLQV